MKDILLHKTGTGYDWTFTDGDLDVVTGNKQIRNGILHEILLVFGELQQKVYQSCGCRVGEYMNSPDTPRIHEMAVNVLADSIRRVDGVHDAQLEYVKTDDGIEITEILITRNDGGMFEIAV